MALYTVRKVNERDKRGLERARFELYRGEQYVTGMDIPKTITENWMRVAPKQLRLNLLNRHGDEAPEFGAPSDDAEALNFAGMLNLA
jgi:hypothetical protein